MFQIGVFFAICLFGEFTAGFLPVPIPSSVIGMVVLFLLLYFKVLKPKHIQEKSDFLLSNMAFFFIPAGVGIIEQYDTIKDKVFPLLIICMVTTFITFGVTALTVKLVLKLQHWRKQNV